MDWFLRTMLDQASVDYTMYGAILIFWVDNENASTNWESK